jgi:hypothetical protein
MLHPPQDKRLDSEGVKAHPWMKLPLPSKYQKPLEEIMAAQQVCSTPRYAARISLLNNHSMKHMNHVGFMD